MRPTKAASEVLEARGDCFRITTELGELLPGIRAAAYDAAGGWDRTVTFDDESCPNWIMLSHALGDSGRMMRWERMRDADTWDSWQRIRVNADSITTGLLVGSVDDCGSVVVDGREVWQTPSVRPLIHELGHSFGFRTEGGEAHDESSAVMSSRVSGGCDVDWPTSSDKSLIDSED